MSEQVIVPFYLNENVINQIYAVIIQKYVKVKSVTRKKQCIVNLTTPLSNIIEGKYLQGDLSIQVLNEYSRERIDERVSILIETFINILDILENKEMLKHINNQKDLNNVKKNDFILLNSKISKLPAIKDMEQMIKRMEVEEMFRLNDDLHQKDVVKSIKNYMTDFKNNSCIKYLTENILDSNIKFIMPLRMEYMPRDTEHLLNSRVWIFAKVINICNNMEDKRTALRTGGCFDYIDDILTNTKYERLIKTERNQEVNSVYEYDFIETVPIAIYI